MLEHWESALPGREFSIPLIYMLNIFLAQIMLYVWHNKKKQEQE